MKAGHSRGVADAWRGHYPITSVALLSLLDRATAGQLEFSRAERHLWVASEFWAAVNSRELDTHLDFAASDPLRDARFAFSAVGAERIVDILHEAAVGTADTQSEGARRHRIADLEDRLLRVPDAIDVLIARFAGQYLRNQRHCGRPRGPLESNLQYRQLLA